MSENISLHTRFPSIKYLLSSRCEWCAILVYSESGIQIPDWRPLILLLPFKQVAWFVSNCHPRNQRMHYARELSKYIQVDIYGACGSLRCPRSQSQTCFDMLDEDYKFYLAFENSNCKDYITEKFFVNGLGCVYSRFLTILLSFFSSSRKKRQPRAANANSTAQSIISWPEVSDLWPSRGIVAFGSRANSRYSRVSPRLAA